MLSIRYLCRRYPEHRLRFIHYGFLSLLLITFFWTISLPLSAFTLYFFDKLPVEFLITIEPLPISHHDLLAAALIFTVISIPMIFFGFRDLSRIRNQL